MLVGEGNVSRHADPGTPSVDAGVQAAARVAVWAVVVAAAAWVAWEFMAALVWAAIIALATWPLYNRLAAIGGKRSQILAPLCFTLVLACFVIVPTMLLTRQIAEGSGALLASLNALGLNGIAAPPWLSRLPHAGQLLDQWWRENLSDPNALVVWLRRVNLESLATWVGSLGGAMLRRVLELLTMLLALFIALRDGAWLAVRCRVLVRNLLGMQGENLLIAFVDAIRATANGTVAASLVKGGVFWLAFVITGVPHPLLFGATMALFSTVPFGAWIILIASAACLLVVNAAPWASAGLGVFGSAALLIMDHLIQPALIGGAVRLPFLLVLIGMIGGMRSLGLLGLFIGPAIMAALLTIGREWIHAGDS
ncbi:AI-2E family transporter [Bradyrhizobium sp. RT3a]|uniref:AI-2E family transporter n=1 Tax=Bradyrhizobium sp. RT3a TaxID=3156333 RepID=UPI003392861A